MKSKIFTLFCLLLALFSTITLVSCNVGINNIKENEDDENIESKLEVASILTIGSGGYGATTYAAIDPFDENILVFSCDMGGFYYSFNKGESYERNNINGSIYTIAFDPTVEGLLWAAGSGVYKSVDHGKTLTRVFPNLNDTTSEGNNYDNGNNWIYSNTDYKPTYQIWSLCINRKSNGNNIFVAQRVNDDGIYIYETTNGFDFTYFTTLPYEYNFKLLYDESNDLLVCATPNKIYEIDSNGNIAYERDFKIILHHKSANILAIDSYYNKDNDKNTFAISKNESGDGYDSICYITDDLQKEENEFVNLTNKLLNLNVYDMISSSSSASSDYLSNEYDEWINNTKVKHTYPWKICNISILNDDIIYLYHEKIINLHDKDGNLTGNTRRTMAYLKYDATKDEKEQFKYVFGLPHKFTSAIENLSWQDSDMGDCFGLSSSPSNDDTLFFSNLVGVYYSPDGDKFYQQNSEVIETNITLTAISPTGNKQDITGIKRTTTNGVDVSCTHKTVTDPFDNNHILVGCTDIGLLQSFDGGDSIIRLLREWDNGSVKYTNSAYRNTCYDLCFDKEKEGVVYSIWSSYQSAPYNGVSSALSANGKFGISYDGGISFTYYSIVSDDKVVPYKMQVEYDGDNRIIYIATYSDGFFVSYDNGETFSTLNEGITESERVSGAIFGNEILNTDLGLFAITGGLAHNDGIASGSRDDKKLYKYDDTTNTFVSIELPTNMGCIRDIIYDENNKCLYLACIAKTTNIWSNIEYTGGGVWKYDGDVFKQICDDTKSMFSVSLDSNGTLYSSSQDGIIYKFLDKNTKYEILVDGLFYKLTNIDISPNNMTLYVSCYGGGTYKIVLEEVKDK